MRNILVSFYFLASFNASAQLKPIKVLPNSIEAHFIDFGFLGRRVCVADNRENVIRILNSDFTVYKIIVIPFNKGYELPIVSCLSDNLFNADTLIEFACQYNIISDPTAEKGRFVVFNEKGEKVIEAVGYHYEIQKMNNSCQLLLSDLYINQEVKVYDLNSVSFSQNTFWGTYRYPKK